jgi:hypothetical protein
LSWVGRTRLSVAAVVSLLAALPAAATDFRVGELAGLVDVRLSYGVLVRVEDRDDRLIAISSGGKAPLSDIDDGDLNYDRGLVSNVLRGTADITLSWRGLGAYVRGYGFYDFENELGDRERTKLSQNAKDEIGSGGGLLDHYISARFDLFGMPVQLRVGDQVLNWGETTFLRNSIDIINPLDFNQIFQPGTEARDAFRPLGMVWGVAMITEFLSVEAFYQYEWRDVAGPPIGGFYSGNDAVGSDGLNFLVLGAGTFSDLGTDLDQTYDLPPGTLGFDSNYMKLPGVDRDPPKDGEQFGFTLTMIVPEWNATKLAWHYIRYHSRLPLLNGRTGNQTAIDATSQAAVDARAAVLAPIYEGTGLSPAEAQQQALTTAEDLATSDYANASGYELVYPEGIDMIGTSFNTAIPGTGTLLSGEMSHRFDIPLQRGLGTVVGGVLSPIEFQGGSTEFGANDVVKGFVRRDKTQITLNLTQLFGPRLGASQSGMSFDAAWSYVHDAPDDDPNLSNEAWGYRLSGFLTYDHLLGGVSMTPFVLFTHDVDGVSPGPGGAFLEDRKTLTTGLRFVYLNAWTAHLSYTGIFDAGARNRLIDRDTMRFSVGYSF